MFLKLAKGSCNMRDLIFTSIVALGIGVVWLASAEAVREPNRKIVWAHKDLAGDTHYFHANKTYAGKNDRGFESMARRAGVESRSVQVKTPGVY